MNGTTSGLAEKIIKKCSQRYKYRKDCDLTKAKVLESCLPHSLYVIHVFANRPRKGGCGSGIKSRNGAPVTTDV